jgi:phenylacetate-CoA ligase
VVTPLGVEGMPLLRFKTGDMCRFYTAPCACGRTTSRISPIIGRKNQMIKYKGTTLYPPMIFDVLNNLEEIQNFIIEVTTNDYGTDRIQVTVGCTNPCEDYEKQIKDNFRAKLRVAPEIIFMDIDEITRKQFPNGNRKPLNFIDSRKK